MDKVIFYATSETSGGGLFSIKLDILLFQVVFFFFGGGGVAAVLFCFILSVFFLSKKD